MVTSLADAMMYASIFIIFSVAISIIGSSAEQVGNLYGDLGAMTLAISSQSYSATGYASAASDMLDGFSSAVRSAGFAGIAALILIAVILSASKSFIWSQVNGHGWNKETILRFFLLSSFWIIATLFILAIVTVPNRAVPALSRIVLVLSVYLGFILFSSDNPGMKISEVIIGAVKVGALKAHKLLLLLASSYLFAVIAYSAFFMSAYYLIPVLIVSAAYLRIYSGEKVSMLLRAL